MSENINPNIPQSFELFQNYPNPFNPVTTIRYSIPIMKMSNILRVQLKIYDLLGNEVVTLVNKDQVPGYYNVTFNANNLASGVYIYRIVINSDNPDAGNFTSAKKIILLK